MLSGVSLHPTRPDDCVGDFYDPQDTRHAPKDTFCGRWSADDLARMLADTGCLTRWKACGFSRIWIECTHDCAQRHTLEVWTQTGAASELLLQAVIWLDYIHIDRLHASFPAFCVEHLRLQRPGEMPGPCSLPGQDFASSGLLRNVFGMIKNMACALGAALITEIPEYFHTAYIFSEYFVFADAEMERIFRAAKRDLMSGASRLCDVSRAFETGRVLWKGRPYLWPTEFQICALSHELERQIEIPPDQIEPERFKIQ